MIEIEITTDPKTLRAIAMDFRAMAKLQNLNVPGGRMNEFMLRTGAQTFEAIANEKELANFLNTEPTR